MHNTVLPVAVGCGFTFVASVVVMDAVIADGALSDPVV